MWYYTVTLFAICAIAEAVGFGGIPAKEVEVENALFIVFLVIFIVTVLERFVRR